jgi:DNA-binding NarL/FixJ family response regulator
VAVIEDVLVEVERRQDEHARARLLAAHDPPRRLDPGALRAGASGFLLKDAPEQQLLNAIRVAVDGASLFAPSVTRRLIERFAALGEPDALPPAFAELTEREREVLGLLARGLSGLRDRTQAVILAYESGLIRPGLA